mmetsp:Transcript_5180/g.4748  ORF Transcript_5180/g.4748 Transcript_5180/m.4748 type:complete len:97 (+) Transcript_5180:316-606(+)
MKRLSEVARFVDADSELMLRAAIKRESLSNDRKSAPQRSTHEKQEEIVRKIIETNSRNNDSLLKIPKELMDEIEELGLDSVTIMREVIKQFPHLFN